MLNSEMTGGILVATNFNSTVRVFIIVPSLFMEIRLKFSIGTGEWRPSKNSASETLLSSLITPYEKISETGIFTWKPLSLGILELGHRLSLVIELKVVLTFFEPTVLILVIPVKLVEKNFAILTECKFPEFLFWSVKNIRVKH
jgi:hypothetical protein